MALCYRAEDLQLARFKGRPGELSPKARFWLFAGWLLPSRFKCVRTLPSLIPHANHIAYLAPNLPSTATTGSSAGAAQAQRSAT